MYLDTLGLVTCAIGNLIDPLESVIGVPFLRPDGSDATWEEISEEWHEVKARKDLAPKGGGHFAEITKLRLSDDGVAQVVARKLSQMNAHLAKRFPSYELIWPSSAQLGVLSMAWAAGPAFKAPHFEAAANTLDFLTCAKECGLHTARDSVNHDLFTHAAETITFGTDLDDLAPHQDVVTDDNRPVHWVPGED